MDKYTCRPLQDGDIPILEKLYENKRQQLGVDFWLPDFADPRTYRVFVFTAADGEIVGAAIFRTIWELIVVGDHPRAMAACMATEKEMQEELRKAFVDEVVAFVPEQLVSWQKSGRQRKSGMEKLMERLGFIRLQRMATFTRGV